MRPIATKEFLYGWQDQLLTTAKAILKSDGYLDPFVWILTYPDLVPPEMRKTLRPLELGQTWGNQPKDGFTLAVLPQRYDFENLHRIIETRMLGEEGRAAALMAHAMAKGLPGYTLERYHRSFVKAFMDGSGCNDKDIMAAEIRGVLKDLAAVAYVKQDDALTVETSAEPGSPVKDVRSQYAKDLADEPRSVECIMSILEYGAGARLVAQPYHRRRKLEGKVKSFGQPRIIGVDRGGKELAGRFVWMLDTERPKSEEAH